MRSSRLRGLSLLETLITLVLFSAFMVALAGLWRDYTSVTAKSTEVDAHLVGIHMGLETLATELAGAVQVLSPAPKAAAPANLEFVRIDPDREDEWLPTPLPSTLPATWDPLSAANLVKVLYVAEEGRLYRAVGPVGQDSATFRRHLLADRVSGLQAQNVPGDPELIEVRLSVERRGAVQVLAHRVRLRTWSAVYSEVAPR